MPKAVTRAVPLRIRVTRGLRAGCSGLEPVTLTAPGWQALERHKDYASVPCVQPCNAYSPLLPGLGSIGAASLEHLEPAPEQAAIGAAGRVGGDETTLGGDSDREQRLSRQRR